LGGCVEVGIGMGSGIRVGVRVPIRLTALRSVGTIVVVTIK
jgi:hypothetical protein